MSSISSREERKQEEDTRSIHREEGWRKELDIDSTIIDESFNTFRKSLPAKSVVGGDARTPCAIIVTMVLCRLAIIIFCTVHIDIVFTMGLRG